MNDSPVVLLFETYLKKSKDVDAALYKQVANQISQMILRGWIFDGTRLPGTRVLAKLLHVHRNTAVAIYEELQADGWVICKPNQGTFVQVQNYVSNKVMSITEPLWFANKSKHKAGFTFKKSFNLKTITNQSAAPLICNEGLPDYRLQLKTPVAHLWKKNATHLIKQTRVELDEKFVSVKRELCNFLNASRGFHIQPSQLACSSNLSSTLYVVAQLLFNPGDVVLVGELSNPNVNMAFQQAGAILQTIPMDKDGINVSNIKKIFKKNPIRCVYIASLRDYPTTATLGIAKRKALLKLASELDFIIIEEDKDFDIQFEGQTRVPLATQDTSNKLIYMGVLGHQFPSEYQIGFVVATDDFCEEVQNYFSMLGVENSQIKNRILQTITHEGELHKLIKKHNEVYKKRRDVAFYLASDFFKDLIEVQLPSGGFALWIRFKIKFSLVKWSKNCEKLGVFIPKSCLFQNKDVCAIRFGYGHFTEEELQEVFVVFRKAFDEIIRIKKVPL